MSPTAQGGPTRPVPRDVLVTGAGGFTGAALVRHLLAQGHRVTAVIRSGRGRLGEAPSGVGQLRIVQADLSEDIQWPGSLDALFHVAARSPNTGVSPADLVRDNVVATTHLVARASDAGAKLFVLFSSLSVYGEVATTVLDEETPICNPDTYGLTKLLCEGLLEAESSSMRSLALRLPGVIGAGSERNWLSRSLAAARRGENIRIFNAEAPFNNAVHVQDLCSFAAGLLDQSWVGYDLVTLGAAGQLPVEVVATLLANEAPGGSQVVIEKSSRMSYLISSARAQTHYGYSPTQIDIMLRQFVRENCE